MRGVCNCVCGPPPNGVCGACGAVGPQVPVRETQVVQTPIVIWPQFYPRQVTEEDVRRIIREEIMEALSATQPKEAREK